MEKFMALAAVWFGKKATVYAIGRSYGFSRVYRRFIEFNHRSTTDKDKLRNRANFVKAFFRLPNRIADRFRHPNQPPPPQPS